jgi:SAM-dependent methyltransferase
VHASSFEKARFLVNHYLSDYVEFPLTVIDFGSQVVDDQGLSYRPIFARKNWKYTGVDITPGNNVDLVVSKPYDWSEIPSNNADVVISGQAFEHIPYFWVTAYEIARILKQGGIAIIIAPSSGGVHRYPVDCWRFYEDGMSAIGNYAGLTVLDVFTDHGNGDWADSVVVLRKPHRTAREEIGFLERHRMQMLLVDQDFGGDRRKQNDDFVSVILDLNQEKASEAFSINRRKALGGYLPKFERIRKSVLILLGEDTVQKLVKMKHKIGLRK